MTADQYTNQELMLEVSDGHRLYVHDWGRADALATIFFLHGGPGGGCSDSHKHLFDPARQRVIFHDQRGSGRSTPYGSLEHNTTQDLIQDITSIADRLGIGRFIVTGGSWGSCLALAYATENPQRVTAMVLRGIFTGSQEEIDWLDHGRFQTFYPDAWQAYLDQTPAAHRSDPTAYHISQVRSDNAESAKKSGYAYECLEGAVISLDDRFRPENFEDYDPGSIRIEMTYMAEKCFMPDRHILDNAHALTMPVWLVQGRYDMVCPPRAAYELHKRLPNGELIWTIGGHRAERETWNVMRTILLQLTAHS